VVFGRDPDYDTNQDAVVRNAAAEVRKRLAQYYLDSAHERELRIDLPSGSYVPDFKTPPHANEATPTQTGTAAVVRPRRWSVPLWAALAAVAATAIVTLLLVRHRPAAPSASVELDAFWSPVVKASGAAQICIGQTRLHYYDDPDLRQTAEPSATVPLSKLVPMRDRFLYFGDAICLSRLTGYLYSKGKDFRLRGAVSTPYSELRGNPVVLIGAFNNQWTVRLTSNLRYSLVLDLDQRVAGVRDKLRSDALQWTVSKPAPFADTEEDYALVTRFFEPDTERWVIAAGGITHFGTMMTGDFLSNPAYFREAVRSAPAAWGQKNMQIVLQTKIVGGTPGPPRVLATHFW
jgi:hypothetical protein